MRDLETRASGAAEARIVGNLAGVVEWANEAFARLSGVRLDETLNKPVGRLLERAGIDLEIVEFVAQHFFEGRVCRVAFPFERPDGGRIDVLLEVEALRDAVGEVDGFCATARQNPEAETKSPPSSEATRPSTRQRASEAALAPTPSLAIDLNEAVRRGVERTLARRRGEPHSPLADLGFAVELDLEEGLERIEVARDRSKLQAVEELVAALVEAARLGIEEAGNAGGVISVATASLAAHRRFVSRVHAIAACPAERSPLRNIVLEVHDTGRALPPAIVAEICDRARALGARIHFDSTPGCGNQLLVLFEPARRPVVLSTPEPLRATGARRLADSTQAR